MLTTAAGWMELASRHAVHKTMRVVDHPVHILRMRPQLEGDFTK